MNIYQGYLAYYAMVHKIQWHGMVHRFWCARGPCMSKEELKKLVTFRCRLKISPKNFNIQKIKLNLFLQNSNGPKRKSREYRKRKAKRKQSSLILREHLCNS